ncbi:hypothetical protein ONS96_002669 [Cadophora gregata f. sp. sojae]|nr:hypothetical protein ONS96_002669 [Cadophora gregata f. sp. sojae]
MEPISALGAAGSVVGIASFGLQLSQVLYQFTTQALAAKESLHTILNGIDATSRALESVHGFLAEECKHLEEKGQAILFSEKAITDVKGTADKCLIIFWRIEAAITSKKTGSKFESTLIERLELFNAALCKEQLQPVFPDPELTKLSTWGRIRWTYIAPRLDQFNSQLQLLQTNLVLMFQVISLGVHRRRPNQREQDLRILLDMYSRIQRMAQQADLSQIGQRRSSKVNEQLTGFERPRLESPVPARDSLHPFLSRDPFRRLSLSPRRRQLSPAVSGGAHIMNTPNQALAHPGEELSGPSRGFDSGNVGALPDLQHSSSKKGKGKEKLQVGMNKEAAVTSGHLPTATNQQGDSASASTNELTMRHLSSPITQSLNASRPVERLSEPVPEDDGLTRRGREAQATSKPALVTAGSSLSPKDEQPIADETKIVAASNSESDQRVPKAAEMVPSTSPSPKSGVSIQVENGNIVEFSSDETVPQGSDYPSPSIKPSAIGVPEIIESTPTPTSNTNRAFIWYNERSQQASDTAVDRSTRNHSDPPNINSQNDDQHNGPKSNPSRRNRSPKRQESASILEELSYEFQASTPERRASSIGSRRSFYDSVSQITKTSGNRKDSNRILSRMKTLFNMDAAQPDPFISAFFIKDGEAHQVPYSGTLKLSQAMMRSIECQSSEQPWHKTFAFMNSDDLTALQNIIKEVGSDGARKIVDLKKVRENRSKFWRSGVYVYFAVVRDFPPEAPSMASRSRSSTSRNQSHIGDNLNHGRRRRSSAATNYPWIPLGPAMQQSGQPPSHAIDNSQVVAQPVATAPNVPALPQASEQVRSGQAEGQNPQPSGRAMAFVPPPPPPRPAQPIPPHNPTTNGPRPPPPPPGQFRPTPMSWGPPQPGILPPRQQSMKIQDISPPLLLTEEVCTKRLTTFKLFTIHRAPVKENEAKSTWNRAQVIQEQFAQAEIQMLMNKLHEKSLPVTEKKAALRRDQQGQVTTIMDDLASQEHDANFHWVLAQLDVRAADMDGKGQGKKPAREDVIILLFAKRTPIPEVNPITLYQILERMKATRLQGPPPPPQPPMQPTQPKPISIMQQQQPTQQGGSKSKTVSMSKPISSVLNKKKKARKDDSSDTTISDSDSSSFTSSDSSTSMTTRSGEARSHRFRSKGSSRRRDSRYRSRDRSLSPRPSRHDLFDTGLSRRGDFDPIASAYQAGKEDATTSRYGNSYSSQYPYRTETMARNYDREEISQLDRYIPNAHSSDRPISGQYDPMIEYHDRPLVARRYPVPDSSYDAYDPIVGSRQTYPQHPKPGYATDAEIVARRGTQYQNRSSDYSRVTGVDSYPRNYDNKPYDPRLPGERGEETGRDSNDIVQQLLLEWTPQDTSEDKANGVRNEHCGADGIPNEQPSMQNEKELNGHQGTRIPGGEASKKPDVRSRQTTVDDAVDELDERFQSPFSVHSFYGSDTGLDTEKKDGTSAREVLEPKPAATISAISNTGREASPPSISQPQPQPQSKPSWLDPSWAQKMVQTTADKPIDRGQSSRAPLQPNSESRYEAGIRHSPPPIPRIPIRDHYPNPASRPSDYSAREEFYRGRERMFEPNYRRESPFGSTDRYMSPRNARHPFAPPQGDVPPRPSSYDYAWY